MIVVNKGNEWFKDFNFRSDDWYNIFERLGYPIDNRNELDIDTLVDQKVIPPTYTNNIVKVVRFYMNDYLEYVILDVKDTNNNNGSSKGITRSRCIDIAKRWKERRMIRPFLIFNNESNHEAFIVIVPHAGTATHEVRTLHIIDQLYRTDIEVISQLTYDRDVNNLEARYDKEFLPYERVRDEFFKDYRSLYDEIVEKTKRYKVKGFNPSSYAQRFLGRLMFLYFLQRKGWLQNNKRFVDSIQDYRELNKIFYEKLNKEDSDLPYLNGSLFEKEDYMDELEVKLYPVMDEIFKKARDTFNKYNFTVEESVIEKEVSLDPLLLGTVLENMLPEYERGSKGTFYTPVKEITFMCRRAIANYLGLYDEVKQRSDQGYIFEDALTRLVKQLKEEEKKDITKREKVVREIKNKLLKAKILDPAVGSGGFLVVMMDVLIQFIHELEATVGWHTDPEELKRKILPNLYGFDIEPEAVEIARLRLWLSLIIDQNYPLPLPNLDLNIQTIEDSLRRPDKIERDKLDLNPDIKSLRERYAELHNKYVNASSYNEKMKLKGEMQIIQEKLNKLTRMKLNVLERFIPQSVDIVVMNPPYVRQEAIPKEKREEYQKIYNENSRVSRLDRTADLYCYFMLRALDLVNDSGVICTITSDKWLEASYGESLQARLKDHLIAIYGSRERTFEADINTVITVYVKSKNKRDRIDFIYLEDYASTNVLNYYSIEKSKLKEGKWYYLRVLDIWYEIAPRLTSQLKSVAEIKFGIKTGANAFFYMKDISHLFNSDLISNPTKFKDIPKEIRTKEDLEKYGLAYIENEGNERFILERRYLRPLLRSPRQLGHNYKVPALTTLCLYVDDTNNSDSINNAKYLKKYIQWGENKEVKVKGKNETVKGYNNLETCKNRKPWYKLPNLKPARIFLPMSWMDTIYIPLAEKPMICDARLYTLYVKGTVALGHSQDKVEENKLWLYLNSTLFYLTAELYGRRLGGGAIDIKVEDYEDMPIPSPDIIAKIEFDPNKLLNREAKIYYEEIKEQDRRELDRAVLVALGYPQDNIDTLLERLYNAFIFVVEDRLIKADRPLKREEEEGEEEGEEWIDKEEGEE
ncbi:MAG: DNA methyltransferase [Candidatus Nitrosocaldaceae archaeon]